MASKEKKKKIISSDQVKSASGVLLTLIGLLVLFSGIGKGQPFSFLAWLFVAGFGSVGFFGFVLFALCYGFQITFHKRIPAIKTRVTLGLLVMAFGLCVLLCHIGSSGGESLVEFDRFSSSLGSAYDSGELLLSPMLLGGALGYALSGLFLSVGEWLVYLVASLVLALGILIVFFPLILAAVRKGSATATMSKAKKAREASADLPEGKIAPEETIYVEEVRGQTTPKAIQAPEKPKKSPQAENPGPNYTTASSMPLPRRSGGNSYRAQAQEASFMGSQTFFASEYDGGLKEASFPFEDDPKEQEEPAPVEAPKEASFFDSPFQQIASAEDAGHAAQMAPMPEEGSPAPSESAPNPVEAAEPSQQEPAFDPVIEEEEPNVSEVAPSVSSNGSEEPTPAPTPIQPSEPAPQPSPAPSPAPSSARKDPYAEFPDAKELPPYEFPPHSLLKEYENTASAAAELEAAETRDSINKIFTDMGVGARVVNYTIGPSVTRYEIQTDSNVSYMAVDKVREDIAIRLGGLAVRFEARVAGLSTSTFEIPNKTRQTVGFKEVLEGMPNDPKKKVYIPFGKSIDGRILSGNLASFPHMLVAGTTGSGKSIFIHGIILSLMMRNRPEELKFVLIDPKRVEFSKYKDMPHLLCPIVKEPSEAKVCLSKLVDEMEERYRLFDIAGVRDIVEYNADFAVEYHKAIMPYIILVVDEYADLVNTCKEISESVLRIGQKARAAGICMVIATQRPDVKIITGTIKSNIPTRVALRVANQTDSVTILDRGGANDLAGFGDMLISCTEIALNQFVRAQGCYVDGREIRSVCDFVRGQQSVAYDPKFLDLTDTGSSSATNYGSQAASMPSFEEMMNAQGNGPMSKNEADEAKYQMIKKIVMTRETCSISSITREFGMGFPRAGRIVARLQKEGILANESDCPNSSHGLKVLKHEESAPEAGGEAAE